MNFWVISPNVENDGEIQYWIDRSLSEKKVFIDYDTDKKHGKTFADSVKCEDIIIVARGARDDRHLYLAGMIISDRTRDSGDGVFYRSISCIVNEAELLKNSIKLNSNNAWGDSSNPGTIYMLKSENKYDKSVIDKLTQLISFKKTNLIMENYIEIIKNKGQVILQGPPGTGKTRMAEIIAKNLTNTQSIGNPKSKIENFFKTFDASKTDIVEKRNEFKRLLNEFMTKFPIDELKNLTLEQYAFGSGDNESFSWWLEYNLWELGTYSGYAKKFLIFWKKDLEGYSKNGFVKDIEDDNEAMRLVAEQISNLVHNTKMDEVFLKLGNGLILKILNSYFPDKYFPINNEKCLNNTLKLFGIDYKGRSLIEKNLEVQNIYTTYKNKFSADVTSFEFMKFLFDNFNLKGEIEFETENVLAKGEYKLIQFHPAYTYEDFVRGIIAIPSGDSVQYKVVDKILAEFAEKAIDNKSANYVIIIDEINRANLPAVLGELIYALEYRGKSVESIYEHEDKGRSITLPSNLFIIGTMNTADRSVGHIDYAIRRRFAFKEMLPDKTVIENVIEDDKVREKALSLFKGISSLFIKNFDSINWADPKPEKAETLASDFRPEDVWIGHSYFLTKKNGKEMPGIDQLQMKLNYEIIPILKEYLKDGVLNDSDEVKNKIRDLHV